MKCVTWNLCTVTLEYVPCSAHHLGFHVWVTIFKRKARIVVQSAHGRYDYSCFHNHFPSSWEVFYRLFNRFRRYVIDGPALWTKLIQHPKGLSMSLSRMLFHLENDEIDDGDIVEPPDKRFHAQLVLNTNLTVATNCTIKGKLTLSHSSTTGLSKFTQFTVPPLVAVFYFVRLGYRLKVITESHEQLIHSTDDIMQLRYTPKSVLWLYSKTFTPSYVPILALTKRNLKGIKCLIGGLNDG